MNASTQQLEAERASEPDENRLAWLALTLAPGLGPKRILDAVRQLEVGEPDLYAAADGA